MDKDLVLCSVTVKKTIPEKDDEWYKIEMTAERMVEPHEMEETQYELYDKLQIIVNNLEDERKKKK